MRRKVEDDCERLIHSISENFNRHYCERNSQHKSYEFVCTAPDCPEDRIVCADCFKTDTRHIQAHGKYFSRIHSFATQASELGYLSQRRHRDMDSLRDAVRRLEKYNRSLDQGYSTDSERIKAVFRKLEERLIHCIQNSVTQVCDDVLEDHKDKYEHDKFQLESYMYECQEILALDDFGYLKEIDNILKRRNQTVISDFRDRVNQIVNIMNNFDSTILMMKRKMKNIGSKDNDRLKIAVDFKAFETYSTRIEDELNLFLEDLVSDPFTGKISSSLTPFVEDDETLPYKDNYTIDSRNNKGSNIHLKDYPRTPQIDTLNNSTHLLSSTNINKKPLNDSIEQKMDELLNFNPSSAEK